MIISDNASTDKTEAICREYQKRDPRIQYVRHDQNRGGYFNFGYCVQKARGVYFTWLAHDDILEKRFLEEMADYLSKHDECVLASGDFEFIDESSSHMYNLQLSKTRETLAWKYRCRELFKYPTTSKIYVLMYGLMRTEMIKKVHPDIFMIKMIKGSEMPLLCRIAEAGQIVSVPGILRKFRLYNESTCRAESLIINKKSALVKRYILFVNVCQIRFDQARVLLRSRYPLPQKLYVLSSVYMEYFRNFLERLIRLPKKIWSYL